MHAVFAWMRWRKSAEQLLTLLSLSLLRSLGVQVIVDDSQPCEQTGTSSIQIFGCSSWFDMFVARSSFGMNVIFLEPKDLHIEKRQEVPGSLAKTIAGYRHVSLPFDVDSREDLVNLWSLARFLKSSVVPWFFVYERHSLACVHSTRQLVEFFFSRIFSPIFLVRVKRGYSSAIGFPADMSRDDFVSKVGRLYGANSGQNSSL